MCGLIVVSHYAVTCRKNQLVSIPFLVCGCFRISPTGHNLGQANLVNPYVESVVRVFE
jgi:hypothetical protein